jgi:hypothetical protein
MPAHSSEYGHQLQQYLSKWCFRLIPTGPGVRKFEFRFCALQSGSSQRISRYQQYVFEPTPGCCRIRILPHHRTKTWGVFERIFQETPELIKAYGLQASELASSPTINPKESFEYGFFANRVSTDATSIWAAAIVTHLLSCMLARVWDGAEATSIWYEIVLKRKEEIIAQLERDHSGEISSLAAAQQDISRYQLRDWDSSARAWLRTADEAKRKEQTQVRLILDNIQKTEVNLKTNL